MCGIVGYIGNKNAVDVIYSGLEKLEYRGYDSAGIAVIENSKIERRRSVGKLINLQENIKENKISEYEILRAGQVAETRHQGIRQDEYAESGRILKTSEKHH